MFEGPTNYEGILNNIDEYYLKDWDSTYTIKATNNFNPIFQSFYQDKIIEKLYHENVNFLDKNQFIDAISPSDNLLGLLEH